jgi:hypothetical protein
MTEEEISRLKEANDALEKLDQQLTTWAGGKVADVSRGFDYLTKAPLTSLLKIAQQGGPVLQALIPEDLIRRVAQATGEFDRVQSSLGKTATSAAAAATTLADPTLAQVGIDLAATFDAMASSADRAAQAISRQTSALRDQQRQQDELEDADMALALANIDASAAPEADKIAQRQSIRQDYAQRRFTRAQDTRGPRTCSCRATARWGTDATAAATGRANT